MIWLWTSIASALLLGCYDIAKKQALRRNGVLEVLLIATALSTLFFVPFLLSSLFGWGWGEGTLFEIPSAPLKVHLQLMVKSLLVAASWIFGILGLKHLPLTTVGIIKASRPVFILLGCLVIFSERLNAVQWIGVLVAVSALWLLSRSSRQEGIYFHSNKWIWCMAGSVLFGVISALVDKYIMLQQPPVFVQGWCDLYITLILAVAVLVFRHLARRRKEGADAPLPLRPDWALLLIALFLTVSDFLYFYSLSCEGSLLSVVSMLRRSSVIVTFLGGAILFREGNLRAKAWEMVMLLAGMALLLYGSY